jgi:tetratricopeptide (TPR) repeat protein
MNRFWSRLCNIGTVALVTLSAPSSPGQQIDLNQLFEDRNLGPVKQVLEAGDYELCVRVGEMARERGLKSIEWRLVHLRALNALGRLEEALEQIDPMLTSFPNDLQLLQWRLMIAQHLGQKPLIAETLQLINHAAKTQPTRDRNADQWVALGQAALAAGADPIKVISNYFQVAQQKDPKAEAPYLAEGWLALEKNDATRAAQVFRDGLKNHGETTSLRHGLAAAFMDSDRAVAMENIVRVLEINPQHEGVLLLRAELHIGAEKFLDAEADIQTVIDINSSSPTAWALRAAVAAITTADASKVNAARAEGLRRWPQNPLVDHTLGRIVSRAYRFAEGASHQRQSLLFDPSYLPAKMQLCHDLLRLGDETEAWQLAAAVREADPYHIQARNLATLEKQIASYSEQRTPHFTLKMPEREWRIYGQRALELLEQAHQTLCQRYQLTLTRPVLVEFFPAQQDFAIRTFGNLGGQGILGACFGSVVTINSPGSLGHGRNNWESTLWHEFCHVVTLTATSNRMPRWLSEGISVYEEAQRDPAWGMKMTSEYRQMILDGETTPVGQLSQAFLNAKSGEHLMFAYFQAGSVVDFLVAQHGHTALLQVMQALKNGTRINDAITSQVQPIEEFESAFAAHFMAQAQAFGNGADWTEPSPEDLNPTDPESLLTYLKQHPTNLSALRRQLSLQLQARDWPTALITADRLITLLPDDTSDSSPVWAKARILKEQNRPQDEIALLRHLATQNSSSLNAYLRLIELETAEPKPSWSHLSEHAHRALALNPFLRTPNEALIRAATQSGGVPQATAAIQRLLALDPPQPSQLHFQLAQLLRQSDPKSARRHLLDALAIAPRFLAAHQLLQEMPSP